MKKCVRCKRSHDRDAKWCKRCTEQQVAYAKERRRRNKLRVIAMFGGACQDCGEDDFRVLTIDHVNNDGHIDCAGPSKRIRPADHYARILAKFDKWKRVDEDLQLLCFNCHAKKDLFADDA